MTQRYKLSTKRTLAGAAALGRYLYVVGSNDGTAPVKTAARARPGSAAGARDPRRRHHARRRRRPGRRHGVLPGRGAHSGHRHDNPAADPALGRRGAARPGAPGSARSRSRFRVVGGRARVPERWLRSGIPYRGRDYGRFFQRRERQQRPPAQESGGRCWQASRPAGGRERSRSAVGCRVRYDVDRRTRPPRETAPLRARRRVRARRQRSSSCPLHSNLRSSGAGPRPEPRSRRRGADSAARSARPAAPLVPAGTEQEFQLVQIGGPRHGALPAATDPAPCREGLRHATRRRSGAGPEVANGVGPRALCCRTAGTLHAPASADVRSGGPRRAPSRSRRQARSRCRTNRQRALLRRAPDRVR